MLSFFVYSTVYGPNWYSERKSVDDSAACHQRAVDVLVGGVTTLNSINCVKKASDKVHTDQKYSLCMFLKCEIHRKDISVNSKYLIVLSDVC